MSTPFFNKSKEIANDFIQSALFVDDEIYGNHEGSTHALDSQALVKAFAKAKKLCALNSPKTVEEFEDVIHVALKSDITILDWKLNLDQNTNADNDEEDVAEIDPRGTYTLQLIEKLIAEDRNELKLVLIYTGETGLQNIVDEVFNKFENKGILRISENTLGNSSCRIRIAGKPSLEGTFTHTPELNSWVLKYEDVPDYLLTEFTKMTSGLVSNVALKAISCLRSNVDKILKIYNKDLDAAFLAHRAMLPVPEDAAELLKDSIVDSFDSIIDYSELEKYCDFNTIGKWLKSNAINDETLTFGKKSIVIKNAVRHSWLRDGFLKSMEDAWPTSYPSEEFPLKKLEGIYHRELHKSEIVKYFKPHDTTTSNIDEQFSILTHHKSNYSSPTYRPKLTLGSIVKGKISNEYWLCIQQKCDSVRIDSDNRRFLFIPLVPVVGDGNFNVVINDFDDSRTFTKLKITIASYDLKTIRFKANRDGVVYAKKSGQSKRYVFYPIYYRANKAKSECYHWVLDLKDSHAQRIANKYAATLSRVGLDEYEWLRRWGGN
ncbi:response regulator receiver domain [Parapedobacter sp. DT-150]|uniref:response regulator receiver domain n=1 Tax=Parapedobacter sp. DT-150 TaxID=3396162 RepID=UPI003F1A07FC